MKVVAHKLTCFVCNKWVTKKSDQMSVHTTYSLQEQTLMLRVVHISRCGYVSYGCLHTIYADTQITTEKNQR
jgi:hypothetical protein